MAQVCIVRQFWYPDDVRVRREVAALLDAGHGVDVVCAHKPGAPWRERHGRLRILRLPLRHRRGSPLTYAWRYATFLLMATCALALLHALRRYRLVQVNTVPDWLVFSAIVPKLTGARVLLDLHEAMPEFYATKYEVPLEHPAVRALRLVEQASIRFADHAITCTEQQRENFARHGADPARIDVVLNSSDESLFPPRGAKSPSRNGRFTLISHGTIEPDYGLDTLIRATALLREDIPELRVEIFGDGTQRAELQQLARDLGLQDTVWFSEGYVALERLITAIHDADLGIVAMRRDAFRDLTHCNKMYDYITLGTPAAVSRTRSVEAYFDEDCFRYFTSGDEHGLARAVLDVHRDPALGQQLAEHAREVAEPYRWPRQRTKYLAIVDRLLSHAGAVRR